MPLAYLHLGSYQPDWGDIPTWCAAVLALVAGWVAYRLFKIESGRDEKAREEARRAQAVKVAAWFADSPDGGEEFVPGALIRNASDLPIYNVHVRHTCSYADGEFEEIDRILNPPAEDDPFGVGVHPDARGPDVSIIPPGECHVPLDAQHLQVFHLPHVDDWQVEVTFDDASGQTWSRDRHGILTRG
ncbi:hypothetical protein [Nonomuraea sp. NPDC049141]|uniref:hypothetical protein n=1 Tax=Nonomuraea sp. NPDC049141 TaxID=3155500 RepID=UPI0033C0E39A